MVVRCFVFFAIAGMAAQGQPAPPAPRVLDGPPLRAAEPVEAIVADLQRFVPEYMRRQRIPGVSIALVRDRRIAWSGAFGVVNSITREPVTPETLFEVASISKVVTAYTALRLVDQGKLALDGPLNSYLRDPWLPPSAHRDTIQLRHVLAHSSGLGHISPSRESLFAAGEGYRYSATGYLYAQAVIEHVSGKTLEEATREQVFLPLGMLSSSYLNRRELTPRTASGHVWGIAPVLLCAVPWLIGLMVLTVLGLPAHRLLGGSWRPARRTVLVALGLAWALTMGLAFYLLGAADLLEFAWLMLLCSLALAATHAAAFWMGRRLIVRWCRERKRLRTAGSVVWGMLVVSGLILVSFSIRNLPVPKWPQVGVGGASSVRTTASDLAAFLIELSRPRHLSAAVAEQLRTPQIRLSSEMDWGLGPGIQHSRDGDALWQWGQHVHFQSFMIIYPEQGFGAVVLTNSDLLNPDVAMEIAQRAVGGRFAAIRRAMHLEYNYRP